MTGRVTAHDGVATGGALPFFGLRLAWVVGAALILGCLLAASAARAADPTDSILTYGCDPPLPRTATNCTIWHTSAVNLRWTLVDPNFTPVPGSDCDTTSLSQDTAGTDITCAVQDASNTRVQKTVTLRVDQTPPTVSGATPARTADNGGWWNHSVAWVFAGTDATSGIAGCDTVTYTGPDSATGDVAGDCRDNAGNSKTGHAAIKYDATAPTITSITPARAADSAGWWNHAVKWTFAGSDATSGVATCDAPTYSGPDTGSGDVAGNCRDNAGNSKTGHATIKYDATPPVLGTPVPSRPPDLGGWWNHPLGVTFTATDATSGVSSCDTVPYAGPDNGAADVSGSCHDVAGNVTGGHMTVKYDATPPTITSVTTSRPADVDGWWNHPVDVVFAGSDATSGIASCDTIDYSGPDTVATDVAGSCSDAAGNSSSSSTPIKYDATPPTIASITPDRPPDYAGWWNHPVKVVFAGSDATSGLDYCDTIVYSGSDPSGDVNGSCTDQAGNVAAGSLTVKYDDQPPVLSALPADAGDGLAIIRWSTSSDTVDTEVTRSPGIGDAPVSTVYSGTGTTFTDPNVKNDQTYTYAINARDQADNLASVTVTVTPHADPAPTPDTFVAVVPDAQPPATPPSSAVVQRVLQPPRLSWRRVKGATYYNVQLFRGKTKILSRWPKSTHLQLQASWTFGGRVRRLTPGDSYRWYVWPGFGKRAQERYGRLIAKKAFTLPA